MVSGNYSIRGGEESHTEYHYYVSDTLNVPSTVPCPSIDPWNSAIIAHISGWQAQEPGRQLTRPRSPGRKLTMLVLKFSHFSTEPRWLQCLCWAKHEVFTYNQTRIKAMAHLKRYFAWVCAYASMKIQCSLNWLTQFEYTQQKLANLSLKLQIVQAEYSCPQLVNTQKCPNFPLQNSLVCAKTGGSSLLYKASSNLFPHGNI